MKSIRSKILLSMVLTVAMSLVMVGGVSIYLNYTSTNETIEQSMNETAVIAAARIAKQLEAYRNIVYDTGMVARVADPAKTVEDKKEIIDQRVKAYGLQRGNLLGQDGISLFDGKDYTDRDYFQHAIKGESYISDPIVSKITGELSIIVAAPLWEGGIPDTKVAGVVYFVPNETFLNDIVNSIKISPNGLSYVLNKNGETIAHPDIDLVINKSNTSKEAESDSSLKALAAMENRMVKGETGFGTYTYGGVKKFLSFAPIEGTDGWSMALAAPLSDFMDATIKGVIITIVLLLAALLVAVLLALRLSGRIGRPIKACADRLDLLAKGDLKSQVPEVRNQDETRVLAHATGSIVSTFSGIIQDIGYGLDAMASGDFTVDSKAKELYVGDFAPLAKSMYEIIDKLTVTIRQISQSSDQVADGSEQVAAGAQALSQGSTEQASAVEELSATVKTVYSRVENNADNAKEASEKAMIVGQEMAEGSEKMKSMTKAMDDISDSSSEIAKIIKTIEDIAFQTNILALNAAVEAARAGEAGKGFAVVADEVRNLANKSSVASKDTSALIEKSMRAVEDGSKIADDAAKTMFVAVDGAKEVTQLINEISEASVEQSQSISQIMLGIDQVSSVVQTNSATSEESAAASEELSSQAIRLKDLVQTFQIHD